MKRLAELCYCLPRVAVLLAQLIVGQRLNLTARAYTRHCEPSYFHGLARLHHAFHVPV